MQSSNSSLHLEQKEPNLAIVPSQVSGNMGALMMRLYSIRLEVDADQESDRNKALKKIKQTVDSVEQVQLLSRQYQNSIRSFLETNETYELLIQCKNIVILTGKLDRQKIEIMIQQYQRHFKDYHQSLKFFFNSPAAVYFDYQYIMKIVAQLNQDELIWEIQTFFERWNKATPDEEKQLYAFLLDENTQATILLTDADINSFNTLAWQENAEIPYRRVTEYEMNRVFLHAILVKPESWSALFASHFNQMLDFLSHELSNKDNWQPEPYLNQDPYYAVMYQLDYLQKRKDYLDGVSTINPDPHQIYRPIVMPDCVATFDEWSIVSGLLSDEKREVVCQSLWPQLQELCMAYLTAENTAYSLLRIVATLPPLLNALFFSLEKIRSLIFDGNMLFMIAERFPDDYRNLLLTSYSVTSLHSFCGEGRSDMALIAIMLPEAQRRAFLDSFSLDAFKKIFSYTGHFMSAIDQLPFNRRVLFLTALSADKLEVVIKNESSLNQIMRQLPESHRESFLIQVSAKTLRSMLPLCYEFVEILRFLPKNRRLPFFEALEVEAFIMLTYSFINLSDLSKLFPENQYEAFLSLCAKKLMNFPHRTIVDLTYIFKELPRNRREPFLSALGTEVLTAFIQYPFHIKDIFEKLPEASREAFLISGLGLKAVRSILERAAQRSDSCLMIINFLPTAVRQKYKLLLNDEGLQQRSTFFARIDRYSASTTEEKHGSINKLDCALRLSAYETVYRIMREGVWFSSWRSNFINELKDLPAEEALDKVIAHAMAEPLSDTARAWRVTLHYSLEDINSLAKSKNPAELLKSWLAKIDKSNEEAKSPSRRLTC
jgi:hypothetical protein